MFCGFFILAQGIPQDPACLSKGFEITHGLNQSAACQKTPECDVYVAQFLLGLLQCKLAEHDRIQQLVKYFLFLLLVLNQWGCR